MVMNQYWSHRVKNAEHLIMTGVISLEYSNQDIYWSVPYQTAQSYNLDESVIDEAINILVKQGKLKDLRQRLQKISIEEINKLVCNSR